MTIRAPSRVSRLAGAPLLILGLLAGTFRPLPGQYALVTPAGDTVSFSPDRAKALLDTTRALWRNLQEDPAVGYFVGTGQPVPVERPDAAFPWNAVTAHNDSVAEIRTPGNLREADGAYANYAVILMRNVRSGVAAARDGDVAAANDTAAGAAEGAPADTAEGAAGAEIVEDGGVPAAGAPASGAPADGAPASGAPADGAQDGGAVTPAASCASRVEAELEAVSAFVDGWLVARLLLGGPPFPPLDQLAVARGAGALPGFVLTRDHSRLGTCADEWASAHPQAVEKYETWRRESWRASEAAPGQPAALGDSASARPDSAAPTSPDPPLRGTEF